MKQLAVMKRFPGGSQPSKCVAQENAGSVHSPSSIESHNLERLPVAHSTPPAENDSEAFTKLEVSNSITSRELYLSDRSHHLSISIGPRSTRPSSHDHCNLVCEESTVDMKDKIYRSVIKKLRYQLAVAESKISTSTSSSKMRF